MVIGTSSYQRFNMSPFLGIFDPFSFLTEANSAGVLDLRSWS